MVRDHAPWRDEETLRQKYSVEERSARELAGEWDCNKTTITNWLRKFDIPVRNSHMEQSPWQDEGTLRELYIGEGLTCEAVGEELGCSGRTVQKWLKRHGLYRAYRNAEWLDKKFNEENLYLKEIADAANTNTHTIREWLDKHGIRSEADRPAKANGVHKDPDVVERLYWDEELSCKRIAGRLGCSPSAVRQTMLENDIPRRPPWKEPEVSLYTAQSGYETVSCGNTAFHFHRLLAIANGEDPHKVFSGEYHVHHKIPIPWLNMPDNIELLTVSEHMSLHASQR